MITNLDHLIFKRTLKRLQHLVKDKQMINRLLSKFYVKTKSIQVIMESCNDDAAAHHFVQDFIIKVIPSNQ
jgi:hypothetical protein